MPVILQSLMKHIIAIIFLIFSCNLTLNGQDTTNHSSSSRLAKQKHLRQQIVLGSLALQQTAGFIIEYRWWWQNNHQSFTAGSDGFWDNYALGLDKFGHAYTSYFYYTGLNEVLKWAEFKPSTRRISSAAITLAWAVSIELGDGFSKYSYSWPDLFANTSGLTFAVFQDIFPALQKVKMKWSYYPTQFYINNGFKNWTLPSDYGGHCYWLSADVHGLLPKNMKRYWPPFLNIAIGYGVGEYTNKRDFNISFDWNLSSITTKRQSVKSLIRIADCFHFPAPGIARYKNEEPRFIFLR